MAKRTVEPQIQEDPVVPEEGMTEEEAREAEEERRAEHERELAPYKALHEQQVEQDELIAELLFKEAMRELEA